MPGDALYQPPPVDKNYGAALTFPVNDEQISMDLSDSMDQPNPSTLQVLKQDVSDEFNQLMNKGQQLIAPYLNDPGVQAAWHIVSNNGATMPVTQTTDSGDTMVRNVAGTALLTSVPIVKLTTTPVPQMIEHPVTTYNNLTAPANQMNSQTVGIFGFAQSNIQTLNPVGQQ